MIELLAPISNNILAWLVIVLFFLKKTSTNNIGTKCSFFRFCLVRRVWPTRWVQVLNISKRYIYNCQGYFPVLLYRRPFCGIYVPGPFVKGKTIQ